MMLDRANVEESITRLAQRRAVGIHLILATQRPASTSSPASSRPTFHAHQLPVATRSTPGPSSTPTALNRFWVARHALPAAGNQPPRAPACALRKRKGNRRRGRLLEEQGQARVRRRVLRTPKDERASVDGSIPDPTKTTYVRRCVRWSSNSARLRRRCCSGGCVSARPRSAFDRFDGARRPGRRGRRLASASCSRPRLAA